MFKIRSKFYVIYGDDNPIYVGYTNRTVRQRFTEHKESKDFSDYKKVQVKELKKEELVYDFTWDYRQICKNADEVSLREAHLVQKYNTQKSVFQIADGGGQTWASEKWFVKSNRNNPKFNGLSGDEIKRLLDRDKRIEVWLRHFVNNQKIKKKAWLNNFVYDQGLKRELWLNSFVNNQRPKKEVWLHSFINSQRLKKETWLRNFVSSKKPKKEAWLNSFVNNQGPKKEVWLHNFVNNQKLKKEAWLQIFVGNQKPKKELWLQHFVNNQSSKKEKWLNNFVGGQRLNKEMWLHSFVGNQKGL